MLTDTATFLWGASGFIAFEVWTAYRCPDPEKRYRRVRFWIIRLLMCGIAGLVAVAAIALLGPAESKARILAMAIGFSTPGLPKLMAQVLRSMIVASDHSDTTTHSPDLDISKILDPASDAGRSQNPPLPAADENQPAEKHENQSVNHH
jgi:hypothetical protein